MPASYLIPAGISALSSGIGYATRKKRRPFRSTAYGQELQRVGREGLYPSTIRSKMVGLRGMREGGIASTERARTRGGLVAGGIPPGSIAGRAPLAEPGLRMGRRLGEYGTQLDIESELGAQRARERYGIAETQWEEAGRLEGEQAKRELFGGIGRAVGLGYQGYMQKQQLELQQRGLDIREEDIKARTGLARERIGLTQQQIDNLEEYRTAGLSQRKVESEALAGYRERGLDIRERVAEDRKAYQDALIGLKKTGELKEFNISEINYMDRVATELLPDDAFDESGKLLSEYYSDVYRITSELGALLKSGVPLENLGMVARQRGILIEPRFRGLRGTTPFAPQGIKKETTKYTWEK